MRPLATLLVLACAAAAQDLERLPDAVARAEAALGSANGVLGVVVGNPPRLVLPGDWDAQEVSFERGGDVAKATRVDGDAELGITVYALPEETPPGVELEEDGALRRGAFVVALGGDALAPHLLERYDPLTRSVRVPGAAGVLLVSARGRFVALRSGLALGAAPNAGLGWTPLDSMVLLGDRDGLHRFLRSPRSMDRFVPAQGDFISAAVVRGALESIAREGRIARGYLGIVPGATREEGGRRGVQIAAVLAGSPAEAAGLRTGEVVIAVDDLPVADAATLSRALLVRRPGERVGLALVGRAVAVTLSDRGEARRSLAGPERLGFSVVDLGPDLRRFLGYAEDARGAVIQEVLPDSPAARAGLVRGGLVVRAGGGPVRDVEELRAAIATATDRIELGVISPGSAVVQLVSVAIPRDVPPR